MDADSITLSSRLKVERANRHIDELIALTSPLSKALHAITIERDVGISDADKKPFGLVYRPLKPIPETMALVIGDAVHNLRAALDHLCTGIVRTNDPTAKKHFPIHPGRENFVTAPVLDAMEQALPGSKRLILDEIRPENGANEALWRFNDLDNDDKHNLLIPTVTVAQITGINAVIGGNVMQNLAVRNNAAKPIYLIASNGPFSIDDNFQTTVEISFGKGGVFEDKPVVPTLTQISQLVTETIDAFARLIAK